jgi:hypothetical protein
MHVVRSLHAFFHPLFFEHKPVRKKIILTLFQSKNNVSAPFSLISYTQFSLVYP